MTCPQCAKGHLPAGPTEQGRRQWQAGTLRPRGLKAVELPSSKAPGEERLDPGAPSHGGAGTPERFSPAGSTACPAGSTACPALLCACPVRSPAAPALSEHRDWAFIAWLRGQPPPSVQGQRGKSGAPHRHHLLGVAVQAGLLHGIDGVAQKLVRILLAAKAEVPSDLCKRGEKRVRQLPSPRPLSTGQGQRNDPLLQTGMLPLGGQTISPVKLAPGSYCPQGCR